jgi:hypothetical protein
MFKLTKNWHPSAPLQNHTTVTMPKQKTLRAPTDKEALEFYEGILNRVRINLAKQVLEHVEMTPEQFLVFQDFFLTKVSWNVEVQTPLHYVSIPISEDS